jgi:hypothetical protein
MLVSLWNTKLYSSLSPKAILTSGNSQRTSYEKPSSGIDMTSAMKLIGFQGAITAAAEAIRVITVST